LTEADHIRCLLFNGKLSATIIIPIEIARRYGLDKSSNVWIKQLEDGILIEKLSKMI
jgi:hypothetical protein